MARIFSLTSHVVYGHVGAQASVPAWHMMGHQVWHLPTVLFSNHPGYGGFNGGPVDLALTNQLIARNWGIYQWPSQKQWCSLQNWQHLLLVATKGEKVDHGLQLGWKAPL